MEVKVSAEEMAAFLDEVFPQVRGMFVLDRLDAEGARMRLVASEQHLRPGGTVSGPAMFSLADVAAYVATMSRIGKEALAVTTHCSIDFMRKPEAGRDLVAEARLLKIGRSLSVTDVLIRSEGGNAPVAHASVTYSIPPWVGGTTGVK